MMRRVRKPFPILRIAIAATALVGGLALGARAQDDGRVVVELKLEGVVDPFIADYVESGIRDAEDRGAAAVLLTIDTPGGLDTAMRTIIQSILNTDVPVLCYVAPNGARAASAGTFILISCPLAAMAPGTNVGAAHPVGVAGAIEEAKATNDAAAYIRSLAELRGRDADWAESAVRDSVSVSAQRALDIGVIDLISADVQALLGEADGRKVEVAGGQTVTIHTAGARLETLTLGMGVAILHTLLSPSFAFLFFYLGIGLIIIELLHPGVSIPGILGILSLVAAFVTFGLLPVQIVGLALLLASAVFFLLELKHPGLGLPTVGGVVTLVVGGLTLFNPSVPNARVSPAVIVPVAAFLVAFFATVVRAAVAARHLPAAAGIERMVGAEGVAASDLDPEGVVQVASESWSARTTGGPVQRGTRVRVVGVERLRLDVEGIQEHAPAVPGQGEGRAT